MNLRENNKHQVQQTVLQRLPHSPQESPQIDVSTTEIRTHPLRDPQLFACTWRIHPTSKSECETKEGACACVPIGRGQTSSVRSEEAAAHSSAHFLTLDEEQ